MKHSKQVDSFTARRRDWIRVIAIAFVTILTILVMTALAGDSRADTARAGIPGVDVCPKEAPYPATPKQGLAGLIGERPLKVSTDVDNPSRIWSSGGFGGLQTHPYDLGCAVNPRSWTKILNANASTKFGNGMTDLGQSVTSAGDSIDRRAWEPGYVLSFLKSFAARAIEVINLRIYGPLLGLAIMVAGIAIAWKNYAKGNIRGAANSAGWAVFVLGMSGFLMVSPLALAMFGQAAGSAVTGALNASASASDGATDSVVEAVHYQGWLRRSFGSADSGAGKTYGMAILNSQRLTWTEYDRANSLKGDARGDYLDDLVEKKSKAFKDTSEKIKKEYPDSYRVLTGEDTQSSVAWVEVAFSLAASSFRIACSMLVVICVLIICLLGMLWIVATPYLVTPRGETFGRSIINSVWKAGKYVLEGALCAWGFTVYLQAALAPGMSVLWSLLLLIVGAGIFWLLLSPTHKIGELLTLGKVKGHGLLYRALRSKIAQIAIPAAVAGWAANRASKWENEHERDRPQASEDAPAPTVIRDDTVHEIYTPTAVFDPQTRTVHIPSAEATLPTGEPVGLPAGEPVYQRADTAPPPPADAATEDEHFEPYQRADDDDNEGAWR